MLFLRPGVPGWAAPLACLLGLAGACGSDACLDGDGDGRGQGCEMGPDCDDGDPDLFEGCNGEPVPECTSEPNAEGCPCLERTAAVCYPAPLETRNVASCRGGMRSCEGGRWGDCEGAVLPGFEQCNGVDDDCDGVIDEAALSPCGGCNADCVGGVWGNESVPFKAGDGLQLTPTGELTLARSERELVTVWVPNTAEGTVSRIDAVEALETARYRTGESPERIAVDYNGDAYVVNRSFDGQSTLTKLAGDASRCVDGDGDGLQTSSGPDDVLAMGQDDCVLFSVEVGDSGEVARSLSVDGTLGPDGLLGGNVWVGMQDSGRLLELNGDDGALLNDLTLPDFAPYGAVFDPWGIQWLIDRQGYLARVDHTGDEPTVEVLQVELPCYALESLAVDDYGRLTLSGFSCENVIHYEPNAKHWSQVQAEGLLTTRGVAVLGDDSWVVHTSGQLSRVSSDPLRVVDTFELADESAQPFESIALGADSLEQLWVVSSLGGPNGTGVATRFDPSLGEATAQVPVGLGPRGQGDLTGSRRRGDFVPSARDTHRFAGCGSEGLGADAPGGSGPTRWERMHVAWSAGVGSGLLLELRHARDQDSLDAAEFQRVGMLPGDDAPFELDLPEGGMVEVRVTLSTDGRLGAPRLSQLGLEWTCPGPD